VVTVSATVGEFPFDGGHGETQSSNTKKLRSGVLVPFCSRVFAEKTRFSPHNA
jgi:hypothetical protein